MGRIAIVTDSVANLPPELVERYDIHVVPALLVFGEQTFRDGVDITPQEFYRRLREDRHLPTTTSAPSVGDSLANPCCSKGSCPLQAREPVTTQPAQEASP